jgi:hypothetical protein
VTEVREASGRPKSYPRWLGVVVALMLSMLVAVVLLTLEPVEPLPASAPYKDDLMLATRMRDTAFKRVLRTMELSTELTLDAPYGSFTLHNNTQIPAVFLTGGIGVTPVRSIVLQAIHDNVPHRIVVFDSNRMPEDAAFLDQLMEP